VLVVSWRPGMRRGKLVGRYTHSPLLPESVGSPLGGARCTAHLARRRGEVAQPPSLGRKPRSGVRPKRTRVLTLYTEELENATTIYVDELGPVSPRTYPPAPGWSSDGHRLSRHP
jgi:hypothetical protein